MLNLFLTALIIILCCFFPFTAKSAVETGKDPEKIVQGSELNDKNVKSMQKTELSPEQTVEDLSAKSSNWQEPSKHSEEKYKQAITQWLEDMQPLQREKARKILHDVHPDMHALRTAIREKKRELANMSINRHTSPQALPRIGQELQALRRILRSKLEIVSKRLSQEVGVPMGPLEGDAFWLAPQDIEISKPKASHKGRLLDKANSNNSHSPLAALL